MRKSKARPHVLSIEQTLPLIQKVAYRIARRLPPHIRVDDLLSVGWIGYREACEGFDPFAGHDFWTYAEWRVKGAMLDELRRLDPLGRETRNATKRLAKARVALTAELGREPTREEVAERMEVSVGVVEELEVADREVLVDHTDQHSLIACASVGVREEEERFLDFQEALQVGRRLEQSFKCLESREESVVRAYYYEEMRLDAIGCKLGVTESRVCQILGKALSKLRPIYEAITRAEQSLKRESLRSAADCYTDVPAQDLEALCADLEEAIAAESSFKDDPERRS